MSINKTKKFEEENQRYETKNRNLEEQHKLFARNIEQLQNDKEVLLAKHKRDQELLEADLEDKR